ncbi:MAG: hypothetical protein HEQ34_13115 [Sphingorhabdus sp.]|uniref:hypothetical protein n=1 Tax=Sphingorhabdus sp. TaxID=1902408 RepID=UPI0025F93CE1|nr:hypothetical protein [Sphingorhabdus sp.]MCO4092873.1 hypothetical protein [Sphingorhabdus sp.]
MRGVFLGIVLIIPSLALATATPSETEPVCGGGVNSSICFASIDVANKVTPKLRKRLALAGSDAINIVSSPEFERELNAFHAAHSNSGPHREYWRDFDPKRAVIDTRANFDGLHIETVGGVRAWFSSTFLGNLAYEGSTRLDGSREILLNRNRLDRPTASLVGTYVHEAAHKAGYSHRQKQTKDQKCEPPYVMGQIASKLADPVGWSLDRSKSDACRFLS